MHKFWYTVICGSTDTVSLAVCVKIGLWARFSAFSNRNTEFWRLALQFWVSLKHLYSLSKISVKLHNLWSTGTHVMAPHHSTRRAYTIDTPLVLSDYRVPSQLYLLFNSDADLGWSCLSAESRSRLFYCSNNLYLLSSGLEAFSVVKSQK